MKWAQHTIAVAAALALILGMILLSAQPAGEGPRPGGWIKLSYGEDERQYVLLHLPGKSPSWVVFVVHGGAFVTGSATSRNSRIMASPFLEKGFAVALVEYRLCPKVRWPEPLEDIASAVKRTLGYLEEEGYDVEGAIYVGHSAGAVAGALLLYGPQAEEFGIWNRFRGYVGMSGGYCLSVSPGAGRTKRGVCGTTLRDKQPFDDFEDVKRIPALLIGGTEDRLLDRFAGRGDVNHQVECFASLLRSKGIDVIAVHVEGGHPEPVRRIAEGDEEVMEAIDDFLVLVGAQNPDS